MSHAKRSCRAILAVATGLAVLALNDASPTSSGYFMPKAQAIIGRPQTPMSYAGVARRTTRRAAYGAYGGYGYGGYRPGVGAAAVGAAAVGAAAYGAGCVQVVDVYGQLVTQCY